MNFLDNFYYLINSKFKYYIIYLNEKCKLKL